MSQSTLPRDARLDQIGFVGELQKHHADDLKSAVKARMSGDSIDRATGDYKGADLTLVAALRGLSESIRE